MNDKTKAILASVFLAVLALVVTFAPTMTTAQTFSTANRELPMPVSSLGGNLGELAPTGTATITLGAAAVVCPTLPAGTRHIYVVPSAAINFGPSTVLSGEGWPLIATGSYKEFSVNPLDPTPGLYFYPYASGTTPVVRVIAVRR